MPSFEALLLNLNTPHNLNAFSRLCLPSKLVHKSVSTPLYQWYHLCVQALQILLSMTNITLCTATIFIFAAEKAGVKLCLLSLHSSPLAASNPSGP